MTAVAAGEPAAATSTRLTSQSATAPSWSAWESLGGQLGQRPVATSWGQDRLDVLLLGPDGANWDRWYHAVNGWQWTQLYRQSLSELGADPHPALPHYLDSFQRNTDTLDLSTGLYGAH